MRIGILTGGGDCPGLNAAIRAVVIAANGRGSEIVGIFEGWRGLIEANTRPLGLGDVREILSLGGTILRTSRTNPFRDDQALAKLEQNWKDLRLDALIAIGGEDTLGVAARLYSEHDWPVVGVPKTIDNDLSATDYTFGFDTAVSIATDAIDRLHTTAESHNRVMVIEIMGRHAGWIALHAGIAGGADYIAIPEREVQLEEICAAIARREQQGLPFSIVAVAEGARIEGLGPTRVSRADEFGHSQLGGIGHELAQRIEEETGFETRVTVLGHIQRGGVPTAYDRVLATRYGLRACDLVHAGDFGKMAALSGSDVVAVDLADAIAEPKTVPDAFLDRAKVFFA
ncbi:MAG: 6-phosphofructokinase [bacterium]|nr:6-phosphofructokinase [bacterium]